jgi:hypothetical protein
MWQRINGSVPRQPDVPNLMLGARSKLKMKN